MVQKFPNLLVLEEAGTETDSPVLRAYGLVCTTRGTKLRSSSEEDTKFLPIPHNQAHPAYNCINVFRVTLLEKCYAHILPPLAQQN